MNRVSLILAAALVSVALSPSFAFAGTVTKVVVKPVRITRVAQTKSGRKVVVASGMPYVEMSESEIKRMDSKMKMTAQDIYEADRLHFYSTTREGEENPAVSVPSQRAGLYRNPDTMPPIEAWSGFSLTSFKSVAGQRYVPTRQERLQRPGTDSTVMIDSDKDADIMATVGCKNPDGYPDVLGLNYGQRGCFAGLRFYKKMPIK